MSGSGRESADARRTVVLAAVVRGTVALKLVFMRCRRVWRVPFAVRERRRDLLGVRIGWGESERGSLGEMYPS